MPILDDSGSYVACIDISFTGFEAKLVMPRFNAFVQMNTKINDATYAVFFKIYIST